MNNIDPHNNAPPPNKSGGGGCSTGNCGTRAPPQQPSRQPRPPRQRAPQQQQLTENQMLRSDLQTAIDYIRSLGGTWPPPGHQ